MEQSKNELNAAVGQSLLTAGLGVDMCLKPRKADGENEAWLECVGLINSGSVDMRECFRLLVDEGAPLWTANVDWGLAKATGNGEIVYKLNERLKVCLSAHRARNVHAN